MCVHAAVEPQWSQSGAAVDVGWVLLPSVAGTLTTEALSLECGPQVYTSVSLSVMHSEWWAGGGVTRCCTVRRSHCRVTGAAS